MTVDHHARKPQAPGPRPSAGDDDRSVRVVIGEDCVDVPAPLAATLLAAIHDRSIASGRMVLAPYDIPIGTEVAADILGVSRPWVAVLLDRGVVPMHRTGSKRRVLLGDLMKVRLESRHTTPRAARNVAPQPSTLPVLPPPTSRWRSSTPPDPWPVAHAPTSGVVELPLRLYWSDDNNRFDLGKRARLRSLYQVVLTEGSSEDVAQLVDRELLLDVWDELWLSPAVHAAWDDWIDVHRHATD